MSVAGSSLEDNFGDSEEDKEFKEVIEQFAKYPLKSEYLPPKSKGRWPTYKEE